jgi:NAD(P)-dependent dehydrogenase (short-subunit alcohol dehydrogenase family)
MDVVAVDRNATALAALAPATAGSPGSALPLPADLIQPDAFDRIVAAALEKFGRIGARGSAMQPDKAKRHGPSEAVRRTGHDRGLPLCCHPCVLLVSRSGRLSRKSKPRASTCPSSVRLAPSL